MPNKDLPLVISAPEPRTLELIFTPPQLARLKAYYRIVETTAEGVAKLPADVLGEARYIIGQPPISPETLASMDLIDRGLPPLRSKRAERETVSRMRSKPADRN